MVQRFQEQILQRMSPERRVRTFAVLKALKKSNLRGGNKENENPTNNNLPVSIKHSTPLKSRQITDLDAVEQDSTLTDLNETAFCVGGEETFVRSKYHAKRNIRRSYPNLDRSDTFKVSQGLPCEVDTSEVPQKPEGEAALVPDVEADFNSEEFLTSALGDQLYRSLDHSAPVRILFQYF